MFSPCKQAGIVDGARGDSSSCGRSADDGPPSRGRRASLLHLLLLPVPGAGSASAAEQSDGTARNVLPCVSWLLDVLLAGGLKAPYCQRSRRVVVQQYALPGFAAVIPCLQHFRTLCHKLATGPGWFYVCPLGLTVASSSVKHLSDYQMRTSASPGTSPVSEEDSPRVDIRPCPHAAGIFQKQSCNRGTKSWHPKGPDSSVRRGPPRVRCTSRDLPAAETRGTSQTQCKRFAAWRLG